MAKIHMKEIRLDLANRNVKSFKDSKCGVRGSGMGISGVKCGDVRSLREFKKALSDYPESCCEHCSGEFARIKALFDLR
jgi:hypothetical protein